MDDFPHVRDMWQYLVNRFSSLSRAHVHDLKTKIHNLVKSGSVSDYLKQLKNLSNKLHAAGDPVSESDLIFYALNGLPQEFGAFKSTIRNRGYPIDFAELATLLEAKEINLNRESKLHPHFDGKALTAQSNKSQFHPNNNAYSSGHKGNFRGITQRGGGNFSSRCNFRGRGNFSSRGGRGRSPTFLSLGCQICGMNNHTAMTCFHRFDSNYQGTTSPQAHVTNICSPNACVSSHSITDSRAAPPLLPNPSEPHWFFDSGASHHVTNEEQCLHNAIPYAGSDSVAVGSGSQLQIHSTGDGILSLPSSSLFLNNILYVPHMSHNLLSEYQLTNNHNCSLLFDSKVVQIRDNVSKRLLYFGSCRNAMYPFSMSPSLSSSHQFQGLL